MTSADSYPKRPYETSDPKDLSHLSSLRLPALPILHVCYSPCSTPAKQGGAAGSSDLGLQDPTTWVAQTGLQLCNHALS